MMMKLGNYQVKQSRVVEGVCVPISQGVGDYDELIREAVRIALRMDMSSARDTGTISTTVFGS